MNGSRKLAWLGLIVWMMSTPGFAVIILPENVDWSKQTNWYEEVGVQETIQAPSPKVEAVKEPKVRIQLHPPEEIPEGTLMLRDIASVECADPELYKAVTSIDLGVSPSPGETTFIFPRRIEASLRKIGLGTGDFLIEGPERIVLEGDRQVVSMEQIEEAIEAGLLARSLEGPGGQIEAFLVRKPTPLNLPPGELEIEILDLDRPGSGIRQVQLAFLVDGIKRESRTYGVRVDHQTHGLVAKRALNSGDVVTPEDLTEGLIPVGNQVADSGVVFDPEILLGTKVLHAIAEGQPITEEDVEREPLKVRGDPVTLVQRSGKVQTTAPGELLEDAVKIGQAIRVKKSNSRKTFVGKLVTPWEVEVR